MGLQNAIVVKDGVLIDGRNRREACRRAAVTPHLKELNGTDPVAFIISSNINRRHMTKGQRAMAVAMIYPDTHQGRRSTSTETDEVGGKAMRESGRWKGRPGPDKEPPEMRPVA